jgi:tRNA-Thr(GGU) m(6)t(6)A37 methyltransferase TsaA
MELWRVGVVKSELKNRKDCPKQGQEGAPEAWIEVEERFSESLQGLEAGQRIVVLTWLHQGRRETQQVYPRGNRTAGLHGVFVTRSPDRPNPIGLHEVEVLEVAGRRIRVKPLEVVDGTPVVDIKPVLC